MNLHSLTAKTVFLTCKSWIEFWSKCEELRQFPIFLLYEHVNDRHRNDGHFFFLENFWEKLTMYLMLLVLHVVIRSRPGRSYGVKYLHHVILILQFCESGSLNITSLIFKYVISDVIQKKISMNCYRVYMNLNFVYILFWAAFIYLQLCCCTLMYNTGYSVL